MSNLGKPGLRDLEKVLAGKIEADSVLGTDNLIAYLKLARDMELNHIRMPKNRYKLGAFNIQTINSYHSRLKNMLIHSFKGVSTKYLNNYLVYNNFVNFAKDSKNEKEQILLNHIISIECLSKSIEINRRSAIPLPIAS